MARVTGKEERQTFNVVVPSINNTPATPISPRPAREICYSSSLLWHRVARHLTTTVILTPALRFTSQQRSTRINHTTVCRYLEKRVIYGLQNKWLQRVSCVIVHVIARAHHAIASWYLDGGRYATSEPEVFPPSIVFAYGTHSPRKRVRDLTRNNHRSILSYLICCISSGTSSFISSVKSGQPAPYQRSYGVFTSQLFTDAPVHRIAVIQAVDLGAVQRNAVSSSTPAYLSTGLERSELRNRTPCRF
jgi:hypothetical protein